MSGFVAMSINQEDYKGDFLDDLFWLTFYQQHMGEEYAGLATYEEGKINIRTHRGHFRPTFGQDTAALEGILGIGYCGDNREPILVDTKFGEFAACFTGNIINHDELVNRLKMQGHSFAWGGVDVDVITKFIAQGDGIVDGIQRMNDVIRGAYSLSILTPEGIMLISGKFPAREIDGYLMHSIMNI